MVFSAALAPEISRTTEMMQETPRISITDAEISTQNISPLFLTNWV